MIRLKLKKYIHFNTESYKYYTSYLKQVRNLLLKLIFLKFHLGF